MELFSVKWMLNVVTCVVSTLVIMTSGHISTDKRPMTLLERLKTSPVYAEALRIVGQRITAVHKANNNTVFFAPKAESSLSGAPFGHYKDEDAMARFFDSHTVHMTISIHDIDDEQIVHNTFGHKFRLNVYYNPKDRLEVYTVNGVVMGTITKCSKDGSHIVRIQDDLLPATQSSVAKAASRVQSLTAFAQALEFTGLGAQIDRLKGPITVFAPTNTALESLPSIILDNARSLKNTLKYHVVNETRYSDGIFEGDVVMLHNKDVLKVTDGESALILHDMAIIELDIPLLNGVLQALDGIFTVPDLPAEFIIED